MSVTVDRKKKGSRFSQTCNVITRVCWADIRLPGVERGGCNLHAWPGWSCTIL